MRYKLNLNKTKTFRILCHCLCDPSIPLREMSYSHSRSCHWLDFTMSDADVHVCVQVCGGQVLCSVEMPDLSSRHVYHPDYDFLVDNGMLREVA